MKNQCIKKVPGVVCNAEIKDCNKCPFYMGIGIIPIFRKETKENEK